MVEIFKQPRGSKIAYYENVRSRLLFDKEVTGRNPGRRA